MKAMRLFDFAYNQLSKYPNPNMFVTKTNGEWKGISTAEFLKQAMDSSKGLISLGVNPGDRIAVVSSNRVEWNVMDIAIQQIGAIMVPIYPNISEADYKYIFNNAGIKHCFVGNEELATKISNIKDAVPTLERTYSFDRVNGTDFWQSIWENAGSVDESEVKTRSEAIKAEDLVTIIYTSGTTGNPK